MDTLGVDSSTTLFLFTSPQFVDITFADTKKSNDHGPSSTEDGAQQQQDYQPQHTTAATITDGPATTETIGIDGNDQDGNDERIKY